MKRLPKEFEARRQQLIESLEAASGEVESAIERMNEVILEAKEEAEAAIEAYNSLVRDAAELRDEAQQAVQDYFDDKSDKWQESEAGEKYQTWINGFDDIEAIEIEVEFPSSIDCPDVETTQGDLKENWPGEPRE